MTEFSGVFTAQDFISVSKSNVILDEFVVDTGEVWCMEGIDWRFHAVKTVRGMCGSCTVEITVVTV
jgi:hypothetical protein